MTNLKTLKIENETFESLDFEHSYPDKYYAAILTENPSSTYKADRYFIRANVDKIWVKDIAPSALVEVTSEEDGEKTRVILLVVKITDEEMIYQEFKDMELAFEAQEKLRFKMAKGGAFNTRFPEEVDAFEAVLDEVRQLAQELKDRKHTFRDVTGENFDNQKEKEFADIMALSGRIDDINNNKLDLPFNQTGEQTVRTPHFIELKHTLNRALKGSGWHYKSDCIEPDYKSSNS